MKKIVIILVIALLAVGTLPAQVRGGRQGSPESVIIEGTLQLHKGQFAVASGDNIYYVPRIGRYVGFIDSLKEGANVSFEGYVFGNFLQPVKMTLSGKTYELVADRAEGDARGNRGPNRFGPSFGGFGPGPGCHGPGFGGNRNKRDNFWGRR